MRFWPKPHNPFDGFPDPLKYDSFQSYERAMLDWNEELAYQGYRGDWKFFRWLTVASLFEAGIMVWGIATGFTNEYWWLGLFQVTFYGLLLAFNDSSLRRATTGIYERTDRYEREHDGEADR